MVSIRSLPQTRTCWGPVACILLIIVFTSDGLPTVLARMSLLNLPSTKVETDLYHHIEMQLYHRDHFQFSLESSPSISHEKTITSMTERMANAVQRSRERFINLIFRSHSQAVYSADSGRLSPNVSLSVQSPVFSQQFEYLLRLSLGTPPQTSIAIADTGSDLVWVQCRPCFDCFNQTNPLFDSRLSSTFRNLSCSSKACKDFGGDYNSTCLSRCEYQQSYADGSLIQGVLSSETLSIGSTARKVLKMRNFTFGCGYHNVGNFAGADGLVGLGRGATSFSSQISSLVGNKFSHCFVSMNASRTETSAMIFGNAAMPVNGINSNISYTPMLQSPINPSMYYVGLENIAVNGKRLNVSSKVFAMDDQGYGGTVIDSGTTLTFLNQIAFDTLVVELNSTIHYPKAYSATIGLELCYNVSQISSPYFPRISFGFTGGAIYHLPMANSFVRLEDNIMCLAMAGTGPDLPGFPKNFSLLGNIQQQNLRVIYDREESRIGFRPEQCGVAPKVP